MQGPPSDQFYQSIYYPERAFDMYLCPRDNAIDSSALSSFNFYQVPSAFSEPFVDLFFKIEKKSGFARLHIETEIVRRNSGLLVKSESGILERGYLQRDEFEALKNLVRTYFNDQMSKYGRDL